MEIALLVLVAAAGIWLPAVIALLLRIKPRVERMLEDHIDGESVRSIHQTLIVSPDASTDAPSVDALRVDGAKRRLDEQMRTIDAIDNHIVGHFGTASTILPISIAILGFIVQRRQSVIDTNGSLAIGADVIAWHMPWSLKGPVILALLSYLLVIAVFINSSRHKAASFRPDSALLDQVCSESEATGSLVRRWLAAEYLDSVLSNTILIGKKSRDQRLLSYLLGGEAFALGVAAVALIWRM